MSLGQKEGDAEAEVLDRVDEMLERTNKLIAHANARKPSIAAYPKSALNTSNANVNTNSAKSFHSAECLFSETDATAVTDKMWRFLGDVQEAQMEEVSESSSATANAWESSSGVKADSKPISAVQGVLPGSDASADSDSSAVSGVDSETRGESRRTNGSGAANHNDISNDGNDDAASVAMRALQRRKTTYKVLFWLVATLFAGTIGAYVFVYHIPPRLGSPTKKSELQELKNTQNQPEADELRNEVVVNSAENGERTTAEIVEKENAEGDMIKRHDIEETVK